MTSWTMAKGLLIHDAVAAGVSVGIAVTFIAVVFVGLCVKDWNRMRKFKRRKKP